MSKHARCLKCRKEWKITLLGHRCCAPLAEGRCDGVIVTTEYIEWFQANISVHFPVVSSCGQIGKVIVSAELDDHRGNRRRYIHAEPVLDFLHAIIKRAEEWVPMHHGSAEGAAHDEGQQMAVDGIADDARELLKQFGCGTELPAAEYWTDNPEAEDV